MAKNQKSNPKKVVGTKERAARNKESDEEYWNKVACSYAEFAVNKCMESHFGCFVERGKKLSRKVSIIFSNNGYRGSDNGELVPIIFRQALQACGVKELGFGVEPSGYTWAMVIDGPDAEAYTDLVRKARFIAFDPQDKP